MKTSKHRKVMPRDRYGYTYKVVNINEMHKDYEWCQKKIDGHGGSVHYNSFHGLAQIGYIGSTGRFKIAYYNTILWFKYIKRKIEHSWGMVTDV